MNLKFKIVKELKELKELKKILNKMDKIEKMDKMDKMEKMDKIDNNNEIPNYKLIRLFKILTQKYKLYNKFTTYFNNNIDLLFINSVNSNDESFIHILFNNICKQSKKKKFVINESDDNFKILLFLIDKGINIDLPNKNWHDDSILQYACDNGDYEAVKFFIEKGANPYQKTTYIPKCSILKQTHLSYYFKFKYPCENNPKKKRKSKYTEEDRIGYLNILFFLKTLFDELENNKKTN